MSAIPKLVILVLLASDGFCLFPRCNSFLCKSSKLREAVTSSTLQSIIINGLLEKKVTISENFGQFLVSQPDKSIRLFVLIFFFILCILLMCALYFRAYIFYRFPTMAKAIPKKYDVPTTNCDNSILP
ncbi:unnamed protein product [Caenorhabditis bovis]|uniref:Uncharacterized protein n=1 Tax=Caenorhabditis bovis TaxID=2654633 RepID=A0A8S1E9Q3_9PELO|nr:unnamed protein product [Caenorhabditis bovis]